jgi:hypothetical protein
MIEAKLVRYGRDGQYVARQVTLDAGMVLDEEHGTVLEIVLPSLEACAAESAVLISATELRKLVYPSTGPGLQAYTADPQPGDWDFLPANYRLADSETLRHEEHNPLISKS